MKIIAIAGGSGAGKSTLTYELIDHHPNIFEVLHLDDYQKLRTESGLPRVKEMINFDHPDIINWSDMIRDIKALSKKQSVCIFTWGNRPDIDNSSITKRFERTMNPKEILIIDGYLSLWNSKLRPSYDRKYFLELTETERLKRRTKFLYSEYKNDVLIPMHNKYIEPTKNYADLIFDSNELSPAQIYTKVINDLQEKKLCKISADI